MNHFSIYHDHDARGDVPKRSVFRAFTKTPITFERAERDVIGSRIWLVMGHGSNPRRYSLCYWFTADTFSFAASQGEEHRVTGTEGQQFMPPISIDTTDWFDAFRATRFWSRGLARIDNPTVIGGLTSLTEREAVIEDSGADVALADLADLDSQMTSDIEASLALSDAERAARIAAASPFPERVEVFTSVFRRNPDVIVEVLKRANGICERCGQEAPFKRASDGSPFLEVHHWDRLADGGEDTPQNAAALCPNCHREEHHG